MERVFLAQQVNGLCGKHKSGLTLAYANIRYVYSKSNKSDGLLQQHILAPEMMLRILPKCQGTI